MKSILKDKRLEAPDTGLSNSIGAVRWTLPDESLQSHSSAPSKSSQSPRQKKDLKDLRGLQECVKLLVHWKQLVDRVCELGGGLRVGVSEQSRRLILEWTQELRRVDELFSERRETGACWEQNADQADSAKHSEQNIMEWAKELQSLSESCGVMRQDLGQFLKQVELKKRKILPMLPFLEFITWCVLKQDSQDIVPQLWLLSKQNTWKTESPKYIPDSVWRWIRGAAVDITLDPMTNHPWLQLSDDKKKVQEALQETEVTPSTRRFDGWPCVLGREALLSGRYYWEVDIANNGYWRIGVTTASSERHGRGPMSPSEGYWVIWRSTRQFYACTSPETELSTSLMPRRLGLYLDYEEGRLSFFDASTRAHIFTFTADFREKLHPLFAPLDGRTLLTLCAVEGRGKDAEMF